jgi:hypothetical protein
MHLDWGAAQILTKQVLIGLVGYVSDELSCDSGAGDHVGCFESRVAGIGPQIGIISRNNRGSCRKARRPYWNAKICFQSFFMSTTTQ